MIISSLVLKSLLLLVKQFILQGLLWFVLVFKQLWLGQLGQLLFILHVHLQIAFCSSFWSQRVVFCMFQLLDWLLVYGLHVLLWLISCDVSDFRWQVFISLGLFIFFYHPWWPMCGEWYFSWQGQLHQIFCNRIIFWA